MDAAAALADIRGYAASGRIAYVPHARDRMRERGVQPRDVRHALTTAEACQLQDNGRWRVDSFDLSGDELTVVAVIEEGVLVVTVF